ncbi:Pentatricopeptide repeat-containing protein At1g04840 [Linum perenne]
MHEEALEMLREMGNVGMKPDIFTLSAVLPIFAEHVDVAKGKAIHGYAIRYGFHKDLYIVSGLINMYSRCARVKDSMQVFKIAPRRDNITWNSIIAGCVQNGLFDEGLRFFRQMLTANIRPGSISCSSIMPACAHLTTLNLGKQLHGYIIRSGFDGNVFIASSLVDMYAKCGELDKANALFDQMPEKNVVSWTTMVNGFSKNGDNEQALSVFSRMLEEDVRPNDFTVVSALSACAKIGALETGLRIHKYITSNMFKLNAAIGTALVDMYAKCGNIDSASQVFKDTKERDILTWSVMIWGWALHGGFEQAALCFRQMLRSGIKPDEVVFLALLTACLHAGKVDLGLNFFNSMRLDYRIEPSMKHYSLVVDLLGRAGRLDEALNFIQKMPINPDLVIWGGLFCACRAHKNVEMAELSARKLLELEPKHPGSYVFLSNAYAAVGRWEDAERVRNLMLDKGVGKEPGWSYIELDGRLHRFLAGDNARKDAKEIQVKLEEIVSGARQQGYTPGTEWVLHNIEEEEKEDALGSHSEKLALAFALIQTSPKTTIRIVKNLRICGDCHSLMKYTSAMSQREIIVRDIKRFHHFKDGTCSCGDYW